MEDGDWISGYMALPWILFGYMNKIKLNQIRVIKVARKF
jgi:hypothetical protein